MGVTDVVEEVACHHPLHVICVLFVQDSDSSAVRRGVAELSRTDHVLQVGVFDVVDPHQDIPQHDVDLQEDDRTSKYLHARLKNGAGWEGEAAMVMLHV